MNLARLRYAVLLMAAVFALSGFLGLPGLLARLVAGLALAAGMRDAGGDMLVIGIGFRLVVALVCAFIILAILIKAVEADMASRGEPNRILSRGWVMTGNVISEQWSTVAGMRARGLYLKAYGCLYLVYCVVYGGTIARDPFFALKLFFLFPLEMVGGGYGFYVARIVG